MQRERRTKPLIAAVLTAYLNNANNWVPTSVPLNGIAVFDTQLTTNGRFPGTTANTTFGQIQFVPGSPNPGYSIGVTGGVSYTSGVGQGFVVLSGYTLTLGPNSSAFETGGSGTVLYGDRGGTIVFNGGSADPSLMQVTNGGGPGAFTRGDGILVVQTPNGATTAPNAFALVGEARAGAYDYRPFRGGLNGNSPEDWFLRSTCARPSSNRGSSIARLRYRSRFPNRNPNASPRSISSRRRRRCRPTSPDHRPGTRDL